MIQIRYAERLDQDFWYRLDRHLPEAEFDKKIRDLRAYVLLEDGIPKGILRYNLFWDNTPFCTLIFIDPCSQKRGFGKMLMEYWETDMRRQGYGMIMTTTRTDEDAQHFYRKLGYQDCGGLILAVQGFEQPAELFLCKAL